MSYARKLMNLIILFNNFFMKPFLAKWKCKYRLAVDAVGFVDLVNPISDLKPIGIKGNNEIKTTMDIFTHGEFMKRKKWFKTFFPGPHFTNREAISGANVVPIGEKSWIKVKTVEADPSVRIQLESCSAVTFPNGKGKSSTY